jgi:hypothetical protein
VGASTVKSGGMTPARWFPKSKADLCAGRRTSDAGSGTARAAPWIFFYFVNDS